MSFHPDNIVNNVTAGAPVPSDGTQSRLLITYPKQAGQNHTTNDFQNFLFYDNHLDNPRQWPQYENHGHFKLQYQGNSIWWYYGNQMQEQSITVPNFGSAINGKHIESQFEQDGTNLKLQIRPWDDATKQSGLVDSGVLTYNNVIASGHGIEGGAPGVTTGGDVVGNEQANTVSTNNQFNPAYIRVKTFDSNGNVTFEGVTFTWNGTPDGVQQKSKALNVWNDAEDKQLKMKMNADGDFVIDVPDNKSVYMKNIKFNSEGDVAQDVLSRIQIVEGTHGTEVAHRNTQHDNLVALINGNINKAIANRAEIFQA